MADSSYRGYILSADGKSESALASESSATYAAMWSPDGSRIVWAAGPLGPSRSLWSIRVADGKPVGAPEQLKANFGNSFLTGFARDGSLFYGDSLPESDIYLADLDPATGRITSQPKRVNEHGLGHSNGRIAWLPDGKSLSFWSTREGRPALVVHTLATGEERELWEQAAGSGGRGYTGWFPDGSLMAAQRNAQSVVYRRLDSRTLEAQATWTVPLVPSPAQAGFSRDLMTIFFAQKDEAVPCEGRICTYVMLARDLQTGKDRQICRFAAGAVGNLSRSVSPDGRDLAFTIQNQDHRLVMIAPTAGGPPREIYRDEDLYRVGATVDWTQDGSRVLAFYDGGHGNGELWSFPVKGGPPERSALHVGANATISLNSAVSPDGTQFAFVGGGRKPEVWVMPSLFPPAKTAAAR
jgi:Tol biopolymer transport system component